MGRTPLQNLFDEASQTDPSPTEILNCPEEGTQHHKKITLGDCGEDNGHLTYRNNLYVPDHEPLHLYLMQEHHNPPAMGHPGQAKILERLQRKYHWPRMRNDVMRYIRNCHTCQRSRTSTHALHGVLCPLAVPDQLWQAYRRTSSQDSHQWRGTMPSASTSTGSRNNAISSYAQPRSTQRDSERYSSRKYSDYTAYPRQ